MKQELDPVALKAAITHARGGIRFGLDDDVLITAAIRTYQKTECKPFKDAPRDDGALIEVFGGQDDFPCWKPVVYDEERDIWQAYPELIDWWKHESCLQFWTHYRIPFNPKAPGD